MTKEEVAVLRRNLDIASAKTTVDAVKHDPELKLDNLNNAINGLNLLIDEFSKRYDMAVRECEWCTKELEAVYGK